MSTPRPSRSSSKTPSQQRDISSGSESSRSMSSAMSSLVHDLSSAVSPRTSKAKKRLSIELSLSGSDSDLDPRPKKRLSTENLKLSLGLGPQVKIDPNEPRQTRPRPPGVAAPNYNVGHWQPSYLRATQGSKADRALSRKKFLSRKLPEQEEDTPAAPRPPATIPAPPKQEIVEDDGSVELAEWLNEMERYFHRLWNKAKDPATPRWELSTLEQNLVFVLYRVDGKIIELGGPGMGRMADVDGDEDGDTSMDMGTCDLYPARFDDGEREEERVGIRGKVENLRYDVRVVLRDVRFLMKGALARNEEGVLVRRTPDPGDPGKSTWEPASFRYTGERPKKVEVKKQVVTAVAKKKTPDKDGEDVVMVDKPPKTEKAGEEGGALLEEENVDTMEE